jgi:hypothetical protein
VATKALDEMVDVVAPAEDRAILKARYGKAEMTIVTPRNETLIVATHEGGQQGDGIMTGMFSATYDPVVEEWIAECDIADNDGLTAIDPLTGEEVQVNTTVFADDLERSMLAETAAEAELKVRRSNLVLDAKLAPLEMAQNRDKEEMVPALYGRGSVKETKTLVALNGQEGWGQTKEEAKYLGNMFVHNGSTKANTDRRINGMRECWYLFERLWYNKKVRLDTKLMLYKGAVFNTGLAGLEAEIQTIGDMNRLEKLHVKLLRKI